MKRRLAQAFVAFSIFVITVRRLAPEIYLHHQLGGIFQHSRPNIPESPVFEGSRPTTTQKESNQYYFWATNGPEGSIRQRLAEYVNYNPNARYNRNVIQTWRTQSDPKTHGYFVSWDEHLPDFNHILYLNNDTEIKFVESFNQDTNRLHDVERTYFDLLNLRILRSDYFKYLAVWREGGIWADMDTFAQQPFDNWLTGVAFNPTKLPPPIEELEQKIGMVVGIEYWGPKERLLHDHHHYQFASYVFAAKQGHPVLLEIISRIVEKAGHIANLLEEERLTEDDIIFETGPLVFTRVVEEWIKKHYDASFDFRHDLPTIGSPTLIGDILILPDEAFSAFDVTGQSANDPRKYIGHSTMGSWRKGAQI